MTVPNMRFTHKGWRFVTGLRATLNKLLKRFG
ncbi:MAG: hypothetical protein ACI9EH_000519 [Planktomarina sp.]